MKNVFSLHTAKREKFLIYNSSVNNRLVHRKLNWHLSHQTTKLPKKEQKLLKGENMKYVTRETGNLLRDSVEPLPDADSDQRQATQRQNSSGSYGRKRPRRDRVTHGDDMPKTSVRPTHSVAPSSTRHRLMWTAAGQPVHSTTPVDTQYSIGTHTDGSASARPSGNSDSHSRPHTQRDRSR